MLQRGLKRVFLSSPSTPGKRLKIQGATPSGGDACIAVRISGSSWVKSGDSIDAGALTMALGTQASGCMLAGTCDEGRVTVCRMRHLLHAVHTSWLCSARSARALLPVGLEPRTYGS